MIDMRKLTQEYKLAARTAPEVYEAVNRLVSTVASEGRVKFRGRKIGVEALLNAVLLDFLDRAPGDQRELLARNVPRFEALLGDEPAASSSPGRVEATGQATIHETRPRSKKGKAS